MTVELPGTLGPGRPRNRPGGWRILGDYLKGRLENRFSLEIEAGILLHRAIDQYTDSHPAVKGSYKRLDPKFRRYAGIITDIVSDHLLALNWSK